jgi:uncharacterized protein YjiS (DUF1127 family)
MIAKVANLRAPASASVTADAGDPANGERDGPCPRRSSAQVAVAEPPAGDDWQGIRLQSFDVGLHPGLHRTLPAAEPYLTSAVQLALRSCWMIAAWMRAVARRRRELRNVAQLQRLDDATLKDLGICRCEIEYLVRTPGSGKWRA